MDKSSPVAMVADPRGVVVSVASTVLAGVGFLLVSPTRLFAYKLI